MTSPHASSCALHNAPASEPGPCDCGATDILERIEDKLAGVLPGAVAQLLAECAITIKAYRSSIDEETRLRTAALQLRADAHEELKRLRAALLKYGQHFGYCEWPRGGPCTCGFEQARGKE